MQLIYTFYANVMAFINDKREEAGQTLVEYALIIALISLLVVALALLVQDPLTDTFQAIADALTGATGS